MKINIFVLYIVTAISISTIIALDYNDIIRDHSNKKIEKIYYKHDKGQSHGLLLFKVEGLEGSIKMERVILSNRKLLRQKRMFVSTFGKKKEKTTTNVATPVIAEESSFQKANLIADYKSQRVIIPNESTTTEYDSVDITVETINNLFNSYNKDLFKDDYTFKEGESYKIYNCYSFCDSFLMKLLKIDPGYTEIYLKKMSGFDISKVTIEKL